MSAPLLDIRDLHIYYVTQRGMMKWRKRLFAFMGRNSQLAALHFGVPTHRLLEVSSQVRL